MSNLIQSSQTPPFTPSNTTPCAQSCQNGFLAPLPYLLEIPFHGFVGQEQHGAHEVSHQDEIPLGFQVQGHDVVVVVAFCAQFLLCRPLI